VPKRPVLRAAFTAALLCAGSLALITQQAAAADPPSAVSTTLAGNGWSTATENAGLGSVTIASSADDPYAPNAADLATGPGDEASGKGGKPYLINSSYGGTPLRDITDLGYSTKVLASQEPDLLDAALNLSLVADDANSTGYSFAGTLVYEPYYQGGTGTVLDGQWQTWNPMAPGAQWWFSRDIVDAQGNVLLARGSTATLEQIQADFAQNPKYDHIRLYPTGGGLYISLGQAGYSASTSDAEVLVDGVTFGGTTLPATTYDFETGIGPCLASVDDVSKTYTLTANCETTSTINVPDGWTLDGAGHTITAVENDASPSFPGAVIASAVGTDAGAAGLNVENLTITTDFTGVDQTPKLYGIYLHRASGTISNVTVDGITRDDSNYEARAIVIDNRSDTGSTDVPRATAHLDHITVMHYQKSGVELLGNLGFTASDLDIGSATKLDGTPLTALASHAVEVLYTAHGSVTDSRLGENNYSTDNTGGDGDPDATAMLVLQAGNVTVTRNVISGTDGDVGIDISNDLNTTTTNATVSCNTFRRSHGGRADRHFGFAVWPDDSGNAGAVNLIAASNTFSGWRKNIKDDTEGTVTRTSDPSCPTVASVTAAPRAVTWHGATTVTAHVASGAGANVAGASVTLQAQPVGQAGFATVATGTSRANGNVSFTDRPARNTRYRVLVAKDTYTGSTSNTVLVLVRPKITVARSAASVRRGHSVTFSGTVGPDRSGQSVQLQRKQGQQ
jgi:hypothetical protein